MVLVAANGVVSDPGRRGRRVPAKMLAAAVALLGSGAVGYWAHFLGETTPIVDVASPVQSCAGDCVSALAVPPWAQPAVSDPLCSTASHGCAAVRQPASRGTTDSPTSAPSSRAGPGSGVSVSGARRGRVRAASGGRGSERTRCGVDREIGE